MALPKIFGGKTSPIAKRMLALDIGFEVVTASVWSVIGAHVKVLKISSPIEWQDDKLEELAEAADVALEELGRDATEIDEVMLGLQEDWIEEDHVLPAKKPLLKNLSEQLKLKPVGFVVSHEALIAYLHDLEGSPLSAICVEYTTAQLFVFVVKTGEKSPTISVGRSGNSSADLSEALSRLKPEFYPSRIVLFGARAKSEELEQEKQEILSFDWKKSFPFLHIPKVETLPHTIITTAICVVGGAELVHDLSGENSKSSFNRAPTIANQIIKEDMHSEVVSEGHSAEDLGFSEINAEEVEEQSDEVEHTLQTQQSENQQTEKHEIRDENLVVPTSPETPASSQELPSQHKHFSWNIPKLPSFGLAFISSSLSSFGNSLSKAFSGLFAGKTLHAKFSSEVSGAKHLKMIIALTIFIIMLGAGIGLFALWETERAHVNITIKTTPISQDVTITLDPTVAQSDPSHGVLKVEQVQKDASGELEGETTGSNTVGDRAKGKVTIYNATGGNKTFLAGTVLNGPNNLKFTFDSETIVASSSGTAQSPQPGTAVANVTAVSIGIESNLGAKSQLTIANFDKASYVASNDEQFSGGSSREIQAVSKDDLTKLETLLTKRLQKEAVDALVQEQHIGTRIIPIGAVTVKSKNFSAKVGDEANTLKLNMTMTATALRYTSSDLVLVASTMLQSSLTDGAILREEKTQIDPGEVKQSLTEKMQLRATLSSEIIPPIDKSNLAERIQGRTIEQANSVLKEQKGVGSVDIVITPKVAQMIFQVMPKSVDRIAIQTQVGSQ